jgi:ferredoxin-NADP reductase
MMTTADSRSWTHAGSHAPASPDDDLLHAAVGEIRLVCRDVAMIELRACELARPLPAFDAGAHIDVHLPNGLIRSYSLCNEPGDPGRYVIGVLRDKASRGGSAWLHDHLKRGDALRISRPRNNFQLIEDAGRISMISGGIGVTPLLSMLRCLDAKGGTADLLYCARSRVEAPFLDEIVRLAAGGAVQVRWHFDDEAGGPPDLRSYLQSISPQGHVYCCGPAAMLGTFEATCRELGLGRAHTERFRAEEPAAGVPVLDGICEIELARSGIRFTHPKGAPVLKGILAANGEADYSCEEGVCGACETRIISGQAQHRDHVLSKAEQDAQEVMMICVSGCRSNRLVLDL